MIKELEIVKQSNEAIGASHPHYGGGKFATPTSSYNTMRPYQCHTISYHHTIIHKQLQYHATQDHTNEQTVHANAIQCHIKPTNVYLTLKQPQYHTIPEYHSPHHIIRIRTIPYHTTQYQYHTRSHSIQNHPQYHTTAWWSCFYWCWCAIIGNCNNGSNLMIWESFFTSTVVKVQC